MSEWWTYTLSDFLLFSSRTYYRLFEIYDAAIWPAQLAGAAAGIATVALLRRASVNRGRAIAAMLAVCWTWVAVVFLAGRYATINWAAIYFAWAFGAEAALLIWIGVVRGKLTFEWPDDLATRAGFAILLFALVALPLAGPLLGRGWRGLQVFGTAPDPTAVGTLGVLLLARARGRGLLMAIPVVWCAVTGLTLLAMKSPEAWIPPLAALVCAVIAFAGKFIQHHSTTRRDSMKTRNILAFAVAFAVSTALLAQASGEAKMKTEPKKAAGKAPSVMPAADLKWTELDPKTGPGVMIADVSGNHATGPFSAFIKFPAGFSAPLHSHTADMKLAVVSGTIIHGPEGKPEVRLGPGSYLGQPGGYKHTTACDKASECVFFTESKGKFDLKPVAAPKAAAAAPEKK